MRNFNDRAWRIPFLALLTIIVTTTGTWAVNNWRTQFRQSAEVRGAQLIVGAPDLEGSLVMHKGDGTTVSLAASDFSELDSLGGLADPNTDSFPFWDDSESAYAFYGITAAGAALLDDAAASNQRTTLGLAIGTNVQAYDAELAALAGLTSAANKGIQFTGSGTAAVYDLTAAGLALLDDATAAAQRTTLNTGQAQVLYAATTVSASLAGTTTDETTTMPAAAEGSATIGTAYLSAGSVFTFDALAVVLSDLDGGEKCGVNVYFGTQLVGTSGQVTLSDATTAIPVRGTVKIKTSSGTGTGVYSGFGGKSATSFGAAFGTFDCTTTKAFTIKLDFDGSDAGDSATVEDANVTWNNVD